MNSSRKLDVCNQSGELNLNYKHGLRHTSFYKKWDCIKQRCLNPKSHNWKHYGGRGITICDEWYAFINFRDDMYESYLKHVVIHGEHNTTIERKDVNRGYSKDNCIWLTEEKQHGNAQNNKWFKATSPDREVYICKNQRCFARKFNLNRHCIRACIKENQDYHKGWVIKPLYKEKIVVR